MRAIQACPAGLQPLRYLWMPDPALCRTSLLSLLLAQPRLTSLVLCRCRRPPCVQYRPVKLDCGRCATCGCPTLQHRRPPLQASTRCALHALLSALAGRSAALSALHSRPAQESSVPSVSRQADGWCSVPCRECAPGLPVHRYCAAASASPVAALLLQLLWLLLLSLDAAGQAI